MAATENVCRSDALAAIHETASDLNHAGTMDKLTLRRFDEGPRRIPDETPRQRSRQVQPHRSGL